jgi:hypothetical protein
VNISIDNQLFSDKNSYVVGRDKSVLASLQDGWHVVRITMGGKLVSERRVFLKDGTQKIINAGDK